MSARHVSSSGMAATHLELGAKGGRRVHLSHDGERPVGGIQRPTWLDMRGTGRTGDGVRSRPGTGGRMRACMDVEEGESVWMSWAVVELSFVAHWWDAAWAASVACIGRIGTLGRWCLHHWRAANERRYSTTSLLGTLTSAPGQACCVEAQHHSVQAWLADRATARNLEYSRRADGGCSGLTLPLERPTFLADTGRSIRGSRFIPARPLPSLTSSLAHPLKQLPRQFHSPGQASGSPPFFAVSNRVFVLDSIVLD